MTTAPELPVDDQEYGSWDDFWAEVEQRETPATTVIRGVRVPIPHDLPLRFDRRLEQLQGSTSEADVRALLTDLFGADVLDAWVEAGMTSREFRTLLRWAVANGRGTAMTFREAYEAVRADEQQGKAQTEATASTPSSAASGDSGPSSKRTSPASTASRRRGSQT